tara:strand:- start:28637 stop:28990 length:354 start_codon:yes stop_codon:yes gene_type:complete
MAERGKIVDSEDELDISSIVGVSSIKSTHRDDAKIKQAAEESGFTSREVRKTRSRGRRSPYVEQKAFKVRRGMNDLYIDIGIKLNKADNALFDAAIQALLEKNKLKEELVRLKEILK